VDSIGIVDKYLDNILADYPIKLNTQLGLLFLETKLPVLLCDFEKNLVHEISDIEVSRIYQSNSARWLPFILEDSTLFFEKDGKLDSIPLISKKFIKTKNILYQPFYKKDKYNVYYFVFALLIIAVIFIIWKMTQPKKEMIQLKLSLI